MSEPTKLLGAIVCGGAGRRMNGVAKGLLEWGGESGSVGESIVSRLMRVLASICDRVVLLTGTRDGGPYADFARDAGLECLPDATFGCGPLGGIVAALENLRADEAGVVCVAGDMPFVTEAVVRGLVKTAATAVPKPRAVIPVVAGRSEPLLAIYSKAMLASLAERLRSGSHKLQDIVSLPGAMCVNETTLRGWDPDLRSLTNLNTPDDLAKARTLV